MKQRLPIILFLLLPFLVFGQNTVQNAGFEIPDADTTNHTGFKGWDSNNVMTISRDSASLHGGRYALKMEAEKRAIRGMFHQYIPLNISEGFLKITFSGWMKRQKVGPGQFGYTGLFIQTIKGDKRTSIINQHKNNWRGTKGWQPVSISTIVASADVSAILVGGELVAGIGTAWFDDFSLKIEPYYPNTAPRKVVAYVNKFLNIMQQNALDRDSVDWVALRKKLLALASGYSRPDECYPLINNALISLNKGQSSEMCECSCSVSQENSYIRTKLSATILDEGIAYLTLPEIYNEQTVWDAQLIQEIWNSIADLSAQHPKGWLLDLRENGFGNSTPMLIAVSPLIGDGVFGYLFGPDNIPKPLAFSHGNILLGNKKHSAMEGRFPQLQGPLPKIAILTSAKTRGAAEEIAIAFKGKANCRSFGEPTKGNSAVINTFSIDSSHSFDLITGVFADCDKHIYRSKVVPDEVFESPDEVLEALRKWLLN